MRFFNTAGPLVAARHYHVPPLERLRLGNVLTLIRDERPFVLHAPRQTGRTTTLLALRDLLNSGELRGLDQYGTQLATEDAAVRNRTRLGLDRRHAAVGLATEDAAVRNRTPRTLRHRVQGPARQPGTDHPRGSRPDGGLHGALRLELRVRSAPGWREDELPRRRAAWSVAAPGQGISSCLTVRKSGRGARWSSGGSRGPRERPTRGSGPARAGRC